eukprot:TRINITY_DN818_c0_g1_i3.p1 TRINITY_DN818_c0_g1~~TRINITY_DN818_c0_g1_i3.p1  ORF type:complete len:1010 (-),score=221.56 TRINITY_DN818_c0_g1_i3:508-3537(-)
MKLFDYFAVLRCDFDPEKKIPKFDVSQRVPLKDHADVPFPQCLPLFVLPLGLEMKDDPNQEFEKHSFVLTSQVGLFNYGACITYYVRNDDKWEPEALCFISRVPCFSMMFPCLEFLASHDSHEMESVLSNMLQISAPDCGETLSIILNHQLKVGTAFPYPAEMGFVEPARFGYLFNLLSLENIVYLVKCILLEQKIIIHSQHIERLSPVIEALVALVYPLSWPHCCIPLLPLQLVDYMQAPCPFIMGIHSSLLETQSYMDCLSAVVLVHLDIDNVITPMEVNLPGDLTCELLPELPYSLKMKLLSALNVHLPKFGEKNIDKLSPKAMSIEKPIDQYPSLHGSLNWITKIRCAFLEVIVNLISGFDSFLNYDVKDTNSPHPYNFNCKRFVKHKPSDYHRFLTPLVNTQCFQLFAETTVGLLIEKSQYKKKYRKLRRMSRRRSFCPNPGSPQSSAELFLKCTSLQKKTSSPSKSGDRLMLSEKIYDLVYGKPPQTSPREVNINDTRRPSTVAPFEPLPLQPESTHRTDFFPELRENLLTNFRRRSSTAPRISRPSYSESALSLTTTKIGSSIHYNCLPQPLDLVPEIFDDKSSSNSEISDSNNESLKVGDEISQNEYHNDASESESGKDMLSSTAPPIGSLLEKVHSFSSFDGDTSDLGFESHDSAFPVRRRTTKDPFRRPRNSIFVLPRHIIVQQTRQRSASRSSLEPSSFMMDWKSRQSFLLQQQQQQQQQPCNIPTPSPHPLSPQPISSEFSASASASEPDMACLVPNTPPFNGRRVTDGDIDQVSAIIAEENSNSSNLTGNDLPPPPPPIHLGSPKRPRSVSLAPGGALSQLQFPPPPPPMPLGIEEGRSTSAYQLPKIDTNLDTPPSNLQKEYAFESPFHASELPTLPSHFIPPPPPSGSEDNSFLDTPMEDIELGTSGSGTKPTFIVPPSNLSSKKSASSLRFELPLKTPEHLHRTMPSFDRFATEPAEPLEDGVLIVKNLDTGAYEKIGVPVNVSCLSAFQLRS